MTQPDMRFIDIARRELQSLLTAHPELSEDDVLRADMVEAETGALELLDNLISAEREACAMMDGTSHEIQRLQRRFERFESRKINLRKYMLQIMEAAGMKKVERPAATVSIAAGRPKVIITDESQIPDYCIRFKREISKEAVAQVLKSGKDMRGAILSNAEPVLRIS